MPREPLLCRLGLHAWDYLGLDEETRACKRCHRRQLWKPPYQNSGWEGGDYEHGHWEDRNA